MKRIIALLAAVTLLLSAYSTCVFAKAAKGEKSADVSVEDINVAVENATHNWVENEDGETYCAGCSMSTSQAEVDAGDGYCIKQSDCGSVETLDFDPVRMTEEKLISIYESMGLPQDIIEVYIEAFRQHPARK